jgi:hypothetical protein
MEHSATFDGKEDLKSLPELCLRLLSEQKETWPRLREGCESLRNARERHLACRGFSVRLQHNPGRIKSSMADVTPKEGSRGSCFLCLDHLPEDQKGILYRDVYLILCNPMPVFSSHFTVSHLDHRRQDIADQIDVFVQIMTDLGSDWMVLYNGPRCGASAPEHLHFQVVPSGQMPIETEIRENKRFTGTVQVDGVLLARMSELGREAIFLQGDDPLALGTVFNRFLKALREVLRIEEEPMINIAGFCIETKGKERRWRLLIFPRRKHRPDAFFRKGNARVVISPGIIDMAGLMITPVEMDFDRVDAARVEDLYAEVSLDGKTVQRAIDVMVK